MRYLYTLCIICLTPWLLIRLWWKGRSIPAYRERIGERFCRHFVSDEKIDIWVHAVSLGEVIAVTPLVELLIKKSYRVLLTTMTPAGSARVQQHFGNKVTHQYAPYDLPGVVKRFFKHYQPRVGLIMETELWPNLIVAARAQHIPLLLVNGRLSEQSFKGYRRVKWLFKPLLNAFSVILVQTSADRQRFLKLGADEDKVRVLGNMKFDLNLQVPKTHDIRDLKVKWGISRPVVMLASTHENEEGQILAQYAVLKSVIPDVMVLIAPRHQDRFEKVVQWCQKMGYATGRRTQPEQINPNTQIVILDSFGELMQAYACSDYAFVGGSFVPVGGHNVLEPIAVGIPVFSGNHVHNFTAICETLLAAKALQVVDSPLALMQAVAHLHLHEDEKALQVASARKILDENRGVVERYVGVIESEMVSSLGVS